MHYLHVTGSFPTIIYWKEANLWSKTEHYLPVSGNFSTSFFNILAGFDEVNRARFSSIRWSMCRSHNDCLWEQRTLNAVTPCSLGLIQFVTIYSAVVPLKSRTRTPNESIWVKPNDNRLKCNMDCALFSSEGRFNICVCFFNNLRHFIQAYTMIFFHLLAR